jgi:hypothetical protein
MSRSFFPSRVHVCKKRAAEKEKVTAHTAAPAFSGESKSGRREITNSKWKLKITTRTFRDECVFCMHTHRHTRTQLGTKWRSPNVFPTAFAPSAEAVVRATKRHATLVVFPIASPLLVAGKQMRRSNSSGFSATLQSERAETTRTCGASKRARSIITEPRLLRLVRKSSARLVACQRRNRCRS